MKSESYKFKFISQHDENSIRKLAEVQYGTFFGGAKISYYVVCFLMLYFGIQFGGTAGTACIMFACLLVTGVNAPARHTADKMLKTLKGNFPKTEYRFYSDEFLYGNPVSRDEDMVTAKYENIIKLVYDHDYYYLFISKFGGYMLPKSQLSEEQQGAFVEFIEKKTDKTFTKAGGFFSFRVRDMLKKNNQ